MLTDLRKTFRDFQLLKIIAQFIKSTIDRAPFEPFNNVFFRHYQIIQVISSYFQPLAIDDVHVFIKNALRELNVCCH